MARELRDASGVLWEVWEAHPHVDRAPAPA